MFVQKGLTVKIFSSPQSMMTASVASFFLTAAGISFADTPGITRADSHAPIGVMGDHRHKDGEFMFSYRYMSMSMEDNLSGDDSISPEAIVTSVANPFPGPPTVRVVPIDMTTNMHMLGMMYAPSDQVTLMAMVNYVEKEMKHATFMGMMGTNQLGTFTTENSGLGDTKIGVLWGLEGGDNYKLHLNLGWSLPTGSIDETDDVLTPMNTRPTLRMPYAMQLGSGTYDFEPGITYNAYADQLAWGAQLMGTYHLGDNDEDYTLGDKIQLSAWSSYSFSNNVSGSLRLSYMDQDEIDGLDAVIAAPVTTANPDNYGGKRLDLIVGFNALSAEGHRLAFEYLMPVEQDLNGVQMEMQSMLTVGYQLAF